MKYQPTPVFWPGKSHGWRSLVGYHPRGCKESDTTEWLDFDGIGRNFHSIKEFSERCSVVSDSLQPHGLYSPWNSPGQGSLSLLQGIFPNQESHQGLMHCKWILYQLSCQGAPWIKKKKSMIERNVQPIWLSLPPRALRTTFPSALCAQEEPRD